MPKSIVFVTIPGRPVPKGRPRLGKHGVYTPETTAEAEKVLQVCFKQACPVPLEGSLELGVSFYFRRPDSWRKEQRTATDEDGAEPWRLGRPDLDNLLKLLKDAGNGILWKDDAQVVKIDAVKVYGAENETVVNLNVLTEEDALG